MNLPVGGSGAPSGPPRPRGLTVSARTQTSISLQWDASTRGASPGTTSTSTAPRSARRPGRPSPSPACRAGPAISSASRPSTPRAASPPARRSAHRHRSVARHAASSPPTPSTTAPAPSCRRLRQRPRRHDLRRDLDRRARRRRALLQRHQCLRRPRRTSAPSTRAASRSRPGCRRPRARRTSACSAAGLSGSGPMLWVDHLGGDYQLTLGTQRPLRLPRLGPDARSSGSGSTSPPPTTAAPPATTSTARRSPAAASPTRVGSSNAWRIGAYGSPAGGFFDGLIDNVRIYNRALSADEVQTDMNLPVPPAGVRHYAADGSGDAVGVRELGQYQLELGRGDRRHRRRAVRRLSRDELRASRPRARTESRSRPGRATPTPASPHGTYYYKVTAEDAAGNVGAASNEVSVDRRPDTTPPTAPGSLTATGGVGTGRPHLGGRDRQRGRDQVRRLPLDDSRLHARARPTGSPSRPVRATRDTGLAAGAYYYKVAAEDAAGNVGAASNEATATVTGTAHRRRSRSPRRRRARSAAFRAVTASASSDQGVAGVQFKLDGQNLGAEDTARRTRLRGTRAPS